MNTTQALPDSDIARPDTNRTVQDHDFASPAGQAYHLLHIGFTVAPILFGLDKFFNLMTDWPQYLAPIFASLIPGTDCMPIVGVIEIIAGVLVFLKPRIGAYVVAGWLLGIIVNLLLASGYYDVALRDFGLMLGALALGRLSETFAR